MEQRSERLEISEAVGGNMQVGTMVQDRVYGGDTRFRLGIIKTVDTGSNQIFICWLVGEQVGYGQWYYPDNVEVICK